MPTNRHCDGFHIVEYNKRREESFWDALCEGEGAWCEAGPFSKAD